MERLESALLTQKLDLINVLVAAVVPRAGIALGVLVAKDAAQSIEDGAAREVFRRDENEGRSLPRLLLFDQST